MITCYNEPRLGKIIVDRNFKPVELLNPISRLKVPFMYYLGKKTRKNWKYNFDQKKWDSIFYESVNQIPSGIFTEFDFDRKGKDLNIGFSLALWLENSFDVSMKSMVLRNNAYL